MMCYYLNVQFQGQRVNEGSVSSLTYIVCVVKFSLHFHKGKGKAVPLQAWSGPEGSRNL